MLRISKENVVSWPVKIRKPKEDGSGKSEEVKVTVRYKLVKVDEESRLRELGTAELVEFLADHIVDWEGFGDSDGNELEYNEENLRLATNYLYIRDALIRGLAEASRGGAGKN